jgi:hypothetical protein
MLRLTDVEVVLTDACVDLSVSVDSSAKVDLSASVNLVLYALTRMLQRLTCMYMLTDA